MNYLLNQIRNGESATVYGVRNQQKLWDWCRAHSENGKVNVTVLRSPDYRVMRDEQRVRRGRATAQLRVRSKFDYATGRNVIAYSDIVWSYVY